MKRIGPTGNPAIPSAVAGRVGASVCKTANKLIGAGTENSVT